MVEALGLTLPPKSLDEEDEEEYSPAELKCVIRNKIIFEERSKGSTIPEICEKLREKGYPTSQRWIWQILHSEKAGQFTEELERVQFRDIALLRAFALQTNPDDPKSRPDLKAFAAAINARGYRSKFCRYYGVAFYVAVSEMRGHGDVGGFVAAF